MHNLIFSEANHSYHLNGVRVPCVTDIIGMLSDFSFVPEDVLDRASKFGSAVHKAVELYENDDLDMGTLHPAIIPYLNSWKKFKAETGFLVTHTEELVYSKKYGYAGTLDIAGQLQGISGILDVKTVATLHPVTALQTAGYGQAFTEQSGILIRKRWALQLKENNYRLIEYEWPSDLDVFISCLNLFNWRKNNA